MSKKLKKRIRDLCGLDALSKEARVKKCHELINDTQFKHSLCNQVLGLTFKDIDKVLKDEIENKKPLTHEQKVFKVLTEQVPEKIDPSILEFKREATSIPLGYYRPSEVLALINAEPITERPESTWNPSTIPTYVLEEVTALVAGTYDPRNFPKKPYRSD